MNTLNMSPGMVMEAMWALKKTENVEIRAEWQQEAKLVVDINQMVNIEGMEKRIPMAYLRLSKG